MNAEIVVRQDQMKTASTRQNRRVSRSDLWIVESAQPKLNRRVQNYIRIVESAQPKLNHRVQDYDSNRSAHNAKSES